ncbi:MAG: Uma2 family endonuclease [Anaerolineae bacterium]|nr:Uma2 family endonuclease [Anaerolineae bacterium]
MAATLTIPARTILPSGEIVATDVSAQEYLARYAADYHEWVRGVVIKVSPQSLIHALLIKYLTVLLDTYFDHNPIGRALNAPFVMRLESAGTYREPDIQVILNANPGQLTGTGMIGPADICIEVVSPESVARDYGDKFAEYEGAGVREYWIIDPLRQRCEFNRLQANVYTTAPPDDAGHYRTPLLPRLMVHVLTLWQDELPGPILIGETVQAMLSDTEAG